MNATSSTQLCSVLSKLKVGSDDGKNTTLREADRSSETRKDISFQTMEGKGHTASPSPGADVIRASLVGRYLATSPAVDFLLLLFQK